MTLPKDNSQKQPSRNVLVNFYSAKTGKNLHHFPTLQGKSLKSFGVCHSKIMD